MEKNEFYFSYHKWTTDFNFQLEFETISLFQAIKLRRCAVFFCLEFLHFIHN